MILHTDSLYVYVYVYKYIHNANITILKGKFKK